VCCGLSNHGFALLGLVIEAIVGEPYATWIRREVIAPFGLTETEPDMPLPPGTPFACGHTGKVLLGRRQVVPGDYTENALTPAGGFVSTAADLARFFAQLSPKTANSPLALDSRREMTRGQWKCPHATFATNYGLGIISGKIGDWDWYGHSGGSLGYVSRTVVVPERNLAIAVLTNAGDGLAWPWLDVILHVARALAKKGEPTEEVRHWAGRWWGAGGAIDMLPAGNRVLVAVPAYLNPVLDAPEIEVSSPNDGRVALAAGYADHGEPVRLVRDDSGTPIEFWAQGTRFAPEAVVAHEMQEHVRRSEHVKPYRTDRAVG
jgi:CubicO group peptidase (beta-lactamase class C family)